MPIRICLFNLCKMKEKDTKKPVPLAPLPTGANVMEAYRFILPMKVRDYECDLQGIVNNANYQHYTEHTRHEFILSEGISFADLHARGIDAVVARITMSFKAPLHSGDEFLSCLNVEKDRARYVFHQDIYRKSDMALALRASVDVVCLVNGTLVVGVEELDQLVANG